MAKKAEMTIMDDLKKLWEKGIGQWCNSLNGKYTTADLKWIKFCELPGGHTIRFWNDGDREPPDHIGIMVFPHHGGKIDLGDLKDIGRDFIINNAVICTSDTGISHHNTFFSEKKLNSYIFAFNDNPLANKEHPDACFRISVDIHENTRHFQLKNSLSINDYKRVHGLEKMSVIAKQKYEEINKVFHRLLNEDKRPWDEREKEVEEAGDKSSKAFSDWCNILNEIRKIRDKYQDINGKDIGADYKDFQVKSSGGISGSLYHFNVDLPCGPPPSQIKEKQMDTMTLIPAPYSAIRNIDETAWEHEFKTKSDAIDFYIEGTHTATTLRELKDMGKKHVRIRFPSGRIEEYDLDVLLKNGE